MIGSLRGKVINFEGMLVTIECASGVGYEVEVPASTLSSLSLDGDAFLYICHIVREDASLLYGFSDLNSRTLFKEIIKVNGLGPKAAMSILSTMGVEEFVCNVMQNNAKSLITIPGVGKKTAERIIVELKDRLSKLNLEVTITNNSQSMVTDQNSYIIDEALSALIGLGYKENLAMTYIKEVYKEGMDTKAIIVAALGLISRSKN